MKLPIELDEISGIFYSIKDTSVFAIQDEQGLLYKIHPLKDRAIERWKFAPQGDYEDVVVLGRTFYVLRSNGDMSVFTFDSLGHPVGSVMPFRKSDGVEFESLYWEPLRRKLILICKDCQEDKKKEVSCYSFDPWTNEFDTSSLRIDAEGVAAAVGQKSVKFKASAAAINPLTGELFIVSAVNKLLVVVDRSGNTQNVYNLPSGMFKQPEGITFSPRGTMFISNEAAGVGVADILIFPYNRTAPDQ
jgi:uncharacterized protein YjiK